MARSLGGADAIIGRTLPLNGGMPVLVVGVVADTRMTSPDQPPALQLYLSTTQGMAPSVLIARARSTDALRRAQAAVASVARDQNPTGAARTVYALAALQDQMTAPHRGRLALLFAIAMSAIAVTAIGLFGAVQDLVGRQTRTIAIRLVLGASRRDVMSSTIRSVAMLSLVGGGIGVTLGATAGRAAQAMLFGVSPVDAVTIAGSVSVLAAVIVLAVALPLRRALSIEPAAALREG